MASVDDYDEFDLKAYYCVGQASEIVENIHRMSDRQIEAAKVWMRMASFWMDRFHD